MTIYDTYHDSTTDIIYHIVDAVKRHDSIYYEHVYIISGSDDSICYGVDCTNCIFNASLDCQKFSDNAAIITDDRFPNIRSQHPEFFI